MQFDAISMLGNIISSGIVATGVTLLIEHLRHGRQRKDEVGFLALQLAFLLESYARECADTVEDHQLASDGCSAGAPIREIPSIPPYPVSDAYKLLNRRLLHEVLEFPHKCALAQQSASAWWEYASDNESYVVSLVTNTTVMGARALDIAKGLRSAHGQPRRNFSAPYGRNLETYFVKELRAVEEIDAKRKAENLPHFIAA